MTSVSVEHSPSLSLSIQYPQHPAMASTTNMCALCLRVARIPASRAATRRLHSPQEPLRAFSRATAAATTRPLYLDFLAPTALKQAQTPHAVSFTVPPRSLAQRTARRALATTTTTTTDPSAPRPAQAIHNPRNDESGNPMRIAISPRASNRLHAISSGDQNPNLALRVSIESGGCHGFQYLMDLTDLGESPATEEDTIFQGEKGEKIVVDESSLELLNGSTVDYTMELIGSQFKITGIPGATSSCGCGTSFDIKL
jgi:iron-sulfur cluster assembly 2